MDLICPDCALIIANDDDSGIADPAAHRARMTGAWIIEMDHDEDFSAVPCACCGTTLAGARLGAIATD